MTKHNVLFHNNCLALVPYGTNLCSTIGYPRYKPWERKLAKIPQNLISVFIGIILSDASIQRQYLGDARLQFKQGYRNFEYFYFVYFKLSHYCGKLPYTTKTMLQEKIYFGLGFTTRSLPCITELHNIFYIDKKKIIPDNLYELLNWESLAHWIMCDGSYNTGITLHTQCYSLKELLLIINVLIIKFRLECSIHKHRNSFVIYIKRKSIQKYLDNLLPYIHESMLYKLMGGLKPKNLKNIHC